MSRSWSDPAPVPDGGSSTGSSVGIIGVGRVGTALGRAFLRAGYPVVAVAARSAATRERAAALLADVPIREPDAVASGCDILLLTVVDDAIAPVASALAAAGQLRPGQYVVHTSGAHGLAALAAVTEVGAVPLAIHPAMTFPGFATDADLLVGVGCAVTAPAGERGYAERLVRDLGGVPVWVEERDRALYHAGLALGANSLVAPVACALDVLRAAGVTDPEPLLGPLVRTVLANALRVGDEALTGPVRRADAATIAAHVDALRARVPQLIPDYQRLTAATALRALRAGSVTAGQLASVLAALGEPPP